MNVKGIGEKGPAADARPGLLLALDRMLTPQAWSTGL